MTLRVYLDAISATRPSQQAILSMMPFFETYWANASSPHLMGQELYPEMEKSYRKIYEALKANYDDVFVFTSSEAEAVNQVIFSVFEKLSKKEGKNHFVVSPLSQASTILAITSLEDEGASMKMAKASKHGYVTCDAIIDALTPRTALVSLPGACALTGVIQPWQDIAKVCRERGILLHIDFTHLIGKTLIEEDVRPDFITFGGECFHAPVGTGGLFCRAPNSLSPLIYGQDDHVRMRGGPLNMPYLVALGVAIEEAQNNLELCCTEVARLRDAFEKTIIESYPEAIAFFQDEERLPTSSVIAFPGIRNEALLFSLNQKGVFANMGGASFQQIELLLAACSIELALGQCALSFSFSKDTKEQDVKRAAEIIVDCARKLRRLSFIPA